MSEINGSDVREGPRFTGVVPVIHGESVAKSLRYYTENLGFEKVWTWSDETETFAEVESANFACVNRGTVTFFLDEGTQGNPGSWNSIFLESLEDLEKLHDEYRQSGARITSPPEEKPWGMREMLVEDPDGNVFRIGASLPPK